MRQRPVPVLPLIQVLVVVLLPVAVPFSRLWLGANKAHNRALQVRVIKRQL